MPYYVYHCYICRHEITESLPIQHTAPICEHCGNAMRKNFQKMIPACHYEANDSVDYNLTGHPIVYHTKGQLKEEARKRGCTLWE